MSRPASEGWERWPAHKSLDGKTWLCRWCHKELTGRQTAWCSPECEYQVKARCTFEIAKGLVFQRDKGVCAECGFDTEALKEAIASYRRINQGIWLAPGFSDVERNRRVALASHWPTVSEFVKALGKRAAHWPGVLWECNHIVALAEGGALADIDNLETLCAVCHAEHTAGVVGRLAKVKRIAKKHRLGA